MDASYKSHACNLKMTDESKHSSGTDVGIDEALPESVTNDDMTSDTLDEETAQFATMLNLTKTVHEDSGYLLVWKLVHPQRPELDMKLFATPERVGELVAANRMPSTMIIPLTVFPGNMELETGNVSAYMTCYAVIIYNIYAGVQTGARW
jgi:hypothetical protein